MGVWMASECWLNVNNKSIIVELYIINWNIKLNIF